MNVSKIVHAAARQLGIVASGENLAGAELQDGIECLQGLLAQWATQRLLVHRATDIVIPLIAGKTQYQIGKVAGDCCEYAVTCCGQVLASPDIKAEISHISDTAWLDDCPVVMVRDTNVTHSLCPSVVYTVDNPNWLFNVTASGQQLKIKAYTLPFKLCAHDELHFPPVYERALKLTLALEMADEYGKEPSALLVNNQRQALAIVKEGNGTPFYAAQTDFNIGVGYRYTGSDFYG